MFRGDFQRGQIPVAKRVSVNKFIEISASISNQPISVEELFLDRCFERSVNLNLKRNKKKYGKNEEIRNRSCLESVREKSELPSEFRKEPSHMLELEKLYGLDGKNEMSHIKFVPKSNKLRYERFRLPELYKNNNGTRNMITKKKDTKKEYMPPVNLKPTNMPFYDFYYSKSNHKSRSADHSQRSRNLDFKNQKVFDLDRSKEISDFHDELGLKKRNKFEQMKKSREDGVRAISRVQKSKENRKNFTRFILVVEKIAKRNGLAAIKLREKLRIREEMGKNSSHSKQISPRTMLKLTENGKFSWRMALIEKYLDDVPSDKESIESSANLKVSDIFGIDEIVLTKSNLLTPNNEEDDQSKSKKSANSSRVRSQLLRQVSEIIREQTKLDPYTPIASRLLKSGEYQSYWMNCIIRCLEEDYFMDVSTVGYVSCFKGNFDPNPRELNHYLGLSPATVHNTKLERYQEVLKPMIRIYKWNSHSIDHDDKHFHNHLKFD